jgi:hypothetical protein
MSKPTGRITPNCEKCQTHIKCSAAFVEERTTVLFDTLPSVYRLLKMRAINILCKNIVYLKDPKDEELS